MQQPLRPWPTLVDAGADRTNQEEGAAAVNAGTASQAPGPTPGARRRLGGPYRIISVACTGSDDRRMQEAR